MPDDNGIPDTNVINLAASRKLRVHNELTSLLEGLLDEAKEGELDSVIISAKHTSPNSVEYITYLAGHPDEDGLINLDQAQVLWQIKQLEHQLLVSAADLD